MPSKNIPVPNCVKVTKVFDWITKSTFLKLKEKIKLEEKDVSDFLCCDFQVPCGVNDRTTLWTSSGIKHVGGSICISFHKGCGFPLEVFINGKKAGSVEECSSFVGSFSDLRSVEVLCKGTDAGLDFCLGKFEITLHYIFEEECNLQDFKDIKKIDCYLSDCLGNSVSLDDSCNVKCQVLSPEERTDFNLINPNGKEITLQRIDLVKQGYVTVRLFNKKDQMCLQCVFPFSEVETVYLCAPPGTEIECKITSFDCRAFAIPPIDKHSKCFEVVVTLLLCQSIISAGDVNFEILATDCKPRDEFTADFCPVPTIPEQCPVFPEQKPSSH